jgi:hypothetical protein
VARFLDTRDYDDIRSINNEHVRVWVIGRGFTLVPENQKLKPSQSHPAPTYLPTLLSPYTYPRANRMPKAMSSHSIPLQGLFPIAKPSGPPSQVPSLIREW